MEIKPIIANIAKKYGIKTEIVGEIFFMAFASFLDREQRRHMEDIDNIRKDLKVFKKKKIPIIYIPTKLWIDVE